METNKIIKILFITGVVSFIVGTIDPMEGSILIAFASVLFCISTYLKKDVYLKWFITAMILIIIGVSFLFYLSALGGFGGSSSLSVWWGLTLIPYPLGWLLLVILLLMKALRKDKNKINNIQ